MGLVVGDSSTTFASGSGATKFGDTRDDMHQMTGSLMLQADVASNYAAIIDNDESSAGHGLKVTSDGNGTGTYLLDVESQSTTVFRVRGDGRVGIGVTSPGSTLSVDDEIAVGEKLIHRGDPDTYVQFPGQNQMILAANDYAFLTYDGDIKINNATRDRDTQIMAEGGGVILHVDAEEKTVGIGTTVPQANLHVNSTSNGEIWASTESSSIDADSPLGTVTFAGAESSPTFVEGAHIIGVASEDWVVGSAEGTYLQFCTKETGTAGDPDERVRIDHDGNVGIGTTSPDTTLDVDGISKSNFFVTTPTLTDLGTGTSTTLTPTTGLHFLDASGVTLASGKSYYEITLGAGTVNGQHLQLAVTGSANNPVRLVGKTGGAKAEGSIAFTGLPSTNQGVSLLNSGGSSTYTVTFTDTLFCGSVVGVSSTDLMVGIDGCTNAASSAGGMYTAIAQGINQESWPFTLGSFSMGSSTTVTLTQTTAGTGGNQTITENMSNATVSGFSGGTELVDGTINSTYGIALVQTSASGGLIQGAHLIYDRSSAQWQFIAGDQLSS